MTARAEFPIRMVPAIVLAIAAILGVLAGADPGIAVIAALGLAFMALAIVNLTAGVCLFAVLSFMDTLFPTGSLVSAPKLIGLLLVVSWLALIATDAERRAHVFDHPAFLWVLVAFIGWIAMSAAWADHTSAVVDTVIRYVPNAMLFFIVFSAIRDRDQGLLLVGAFVVGAPGSAAY